MRSAALRAASGVGRDARLRAASGVMSSQQTARRGAQIANPKSKNPMTAGGWIVLILSVGSVSSLFLWCLYRVIFRAPPERLHGIDDIDIGED
jgi:hypothetical protein